MPVYANRAHVYTTTTGTGTITLSSVVPGFQSFASAGIVNGNVVSYTIEDGNNFEVGVGTYSSTGPTLTRTLVQSSTGALLNLTGSARVYVIMSAADMTALAVLGSAATFPSVSSTSSLALAAATANPITFSIGASEAARFDSNMRLLLGSAASTVINTFTNGTTVQPELQVSGTTIGTSSTVNIDYNSSAANNNPMLAMARSRGTSASSRGAVTNNDWLGTVTFMGDDGTDFVASATISGLVDGTPATGSVPSRLVLRTTSSGGTVPSDRVTIDNSGVVNLLTGGLQRGGVNAYTLRSIPTPITSGVAQTYTPPANCRAIKVILTGGGGGGGGVAVGAAGTSRIAGAGGGGATAIKWIFNPSGSYTYTIGAGGTAGAAGANNGGTGGTSTFSGTGASLSCPGGLGGGGTTASSSTAVSGGTSGNGGSAAAAGGDINIDGSTGITGMSSAGTIIITCYAGISFWGGNSIRGTYGTAAGTAGVNWGAGATGAGVEGATTSQAGAVGATGVLYIEEYF